MEIPNAFIENQEQGIKFFKDLSSDFESIQSIAIQTIIADSKLSFVDKNEYIDKFKELIDDLLQDIDKQKELFVSGTELRLRHIENIYEDDIMSQEKDLIKKAEDFCKSYNSIDFNLDLLKKISQNSIYTKNHFNTLFDCYYNRANEILSSSFNCVMDKTKAQEHYGTYLISYPIYQNDKEVIKAEYGFTNEK